MKKFALWTVGVLVAVTIVWFVGIDLLKLVMYGTPIGESEVNAQVAAANYCTTTADCAVSSGGCPFMPELVNVKEQKKVADLYGRYSVWNGICMYNVLDMRDFDRISCKLGKCVVPRKGKVEEKGGRMKDEG